MNIFTFTRQIDILRNEVFSIYNTHPGDTRPGVPSMNNFRVPGLRFESSAKIDDIISFGLASPEEERISILNYLYGKDSTAKLYGCDLSDPFNGAKLFFVLLVKKKGNVDKIKHIPVRLCDKVSFNILNPETSEEYQICVDKEIDESDKLGRPIYSYWVKYLKSDIPIFDLEIHRGEAMKISQYNY